MKRGWIAALLALACLCSGCAGQKNEAASAAVVTFSDDLGRIVSVNRPQRVAALLGSFAQIWQLAGGSVCATVDDAWDDLQLDLGADTVNLGNLKGLSLELLLDAQPDFVLASTNTRQNIEWKDTLEQAGIPVAYFDVSGFEDYLRMLDICTNITGRKDLYTQYGEEVQAQIESVLEKSGQRLQEQDAPRVLCLTASAALIRVKNSQDSVMGRMLYDLGCVNIADSNAMLLEKLSMEYILTQDPDCIFIVQRGNDAEGMREYVRQQLEQDPLWSALTAVKNGRVYFMDKNLYNLKPNHRWGEAYEKLEEILSNGV